MLLLAAGQSLTGGVLVLVHCADSTVPGDEEGLRQGPVALRDANLDEDATDGASFLDTQLPSGRPKRARRADCCVCCGLRYVTPFASAIRLEVCVFHVREVAHPRFGDPNIAGVASSGRRSVSCACCLGCGRRLGLRCGLRRCVLLR